MLSWGYLLAYFRGVLILHGPNPFSAMSLMINNYFVAQAANSANMSILLLMIFVAGLVGLMGRSGAAAAFAKMMLVDITSKAKAQVTAWTSGAMLFFTDSDTPLIVGP
jgi:Na+/H+ antiporter NhaC